MTPDKGLIDRSNNWWQVRQIAEEVLASPDADRDRILQASCAGNEELQEQVERLIKAAEACDAASRIAGVRQYPCDQEAYASGDQFGPYRLVKRLGVGGFGEVWMAEQTTPVRRHVAIKLIRPGMDCGQVIARFEAERQALAMMNHPNIAGVFDANSTDEGQPYFVMEMVHGLSITEFCKKYCVDIAGRIQLIQTVCSAVQHAHQKGIIHRDLKPSNVLVSDVDGRAVVKVIDFGVAKALEGPLTNEKAVTEFRQFIGTPAYMSPEQADLSLVDVDTRSDVYALGVMLYELLVGTPPFDADLLQSVGFDEMRRVIREVDPELPSERLKKTEKARISMADGPAFSVSRIHRQLKGELDWVVCRAIAKQRDHRYATANDLSEDLKRYLHGQPVEAGPPSTLYRLQKTIQRNKVAMSFSALFVMALLGFVGVLLLDNHRVREAREAAEAARLIADGKAEEASRERAVSNAVVTFLTQDMLAAGVPSLMEGRGRDMTVRGMLDAASGRIDDAFINQPAVEAQVRMTIGQSYRAMGFYREADPHFERAHELWRDLLGADAEATIQALEGRASQAAHSGNMELAQSLLEEVISLRMKVHGPNKAETIAARSSLFYLFKFEGRYEEAAALMRELYPEVCAIYGPDHVESNNILVNLAGVLRMLGDYEEAEEVAKELVKRSTERLGSTHDLTLGVVNLLAHVYKDQGRDDAAVELLSGVIEAVRTKLHTRVAWNGQGEEGIVDRGGVVPEVSESQRLRLLSIETNLAHLYFKRGEFNESIVLFDDVLDQRIRLYGSMHPRVLTAYVHCIQARMGSSRFDEAKVLLEDAKPLAMQIYGPDHVETVFLDVCEARVLLADQEIADAIQLGEHGLSVLEEVRGDSHPDTQYALRVLHSVYSSYANQDEEGDWEAKAKALSARIISKRMLALDTIED